MSERMRLDAALKQAKEYNSKKKSTSKKVKSSNTRTKKMADTALKVNDEVDEIIEPIYDEITSSKDIVEPLEVKEDTATIENNKIESNFAKKINQKRHSDVENKVHVIVNAKNATCLIYNKDELILEKQVRGFDKKYLGVVANYSKKVVESRKENLKQSFSLTDEQAERVDSFIFTTLRDYDDYIWAKEGILSYKSEEYVECLAQDFARNENEEKNDYISRCQANRMNFLNEKNIRIDYDLEGLWSTFNLKFSEKKMMSKFSDSYDLKNKIER